MPVCTGSPDLALANMKIGIPVFGEEKHTQGTNMGSNRFRIDMPCYIEFYRQWQLKLDDMVTRKNKARANNPGHRRHEARQRHRL